ncbi:rab11 family-interacting protein 1 [Echinops telfairi]|uniref:Rab11 family-interacting protein 1 n=1 Tax=Echinops telfairi TaxID=9371 RepID=A0ABM1VIT6_ECHTE|nr:rab11 family-interacting protein 1 [Echinops telfairi]
MRNNMTASMFDLSMKDKSRNPFGKLKDKIKGKNKDGASDSASAIVPSLTPSVDSDDESSTKDKKKKSKIKTLFSKSNLHKTPLSQSMSVLPTSKSDKVLLRPGDFPSQWDDDNEDASSSASDLMTHKRTASADLKQLTQISFTLPRKEGLSFLGGLRSKNDTLSRSNVCINGNHVYLEQPESKSETKDSTPSSSPSPQAFGRKHLFSSTENLAPRSWKEPGEAGGAASDRQSSEPSTKDSLKSMSLPSYQPLASGDVQGNTAAGNAEAAKETKESKKQDSKKPSLLSLVTGKKDVAKGSDGESPPTKGKEGTLLESKAREDRPEPVRDLVRKSEKHPPATVSERSRSLNPFEEVQLTEPEAEPEPTPDPAPPVPAPRALQTKAVKPRLEVSPEAQPKARLPPPPDSLLFFPALSAASGQTLLPSELGLDSETRSSESPPVSSFFSSPVEPPLSTSTPTDSRPHADEGQASSEEPSPPPKPGLHEEHVTEVPDPVGSHFPQPRTPAHHGAEDRAEEKTAALDPEHTSTEEPQNSPLLQPDTEPQEEGLRRSSPAKEGYPHSSDQPGARTLGPSVRSGRIGSSAETPWIGEKGNSDAAAQSRSLVGNTVRDSQVATAVQEAAPPLPMVGSVPQVDPVTQNRGVGGLHAGKDQKKVKKQVSFPEQLLVEEEAEQSPGWAGKGSGNPQELPREGAAAGGVQVRESPESPRREEPEWEADTEDQLLSRGALAPTADTEETSLVGPEGDASGFEKDTALLGTEGDDEGPLMEERCQSRASDHEGLLSDPLSDLESAAGANSPVMADLNLTLPSIPEVASDDERVEDPVEVVREIARPAAWEGGASSLSVFLPCPKNKGGPSGSLGDGPRPAVPAESLHDLRPKAPRAPVTASSQQAAALGIHKPHLGKSLSLDKQLPGGEGGGSSSSSSEEENGRPGQPPGEPLDCPVSSPPCPEPFPATHSFPSSPHAHTHHTSTAESQKKAPAEGSAAKVDSSGKRKPLLQAWVSPSETHPVSAQPGTGTWSAKHRLHPVKPMNTTATKVANSSLGTATIISENWINDATMKKYNPSDPAFAYVQLTHDELIQLVLKQKETISKREFQVRELEDYIDNLLVRVMEETPNILRVPAQVGRKAGKM